MPRTSSENLLAVDPTARAPPAGPRQLETSQSPGEVLVRHSLNLGPSASDGGPSILNSGLAVAGD
jgi:hypothetical protein